MNAKEIDFPRDIDIKCLRIVPPLFNNGNIPLNGLYNDIYNIEDMKIYPLENKMKNFNFSSDNINIGNAFSLSSKFGKVLANEDLESLLIFMNKSNNEIEVKNIKINISSEVKNSKIEQKKFNCNVPSGTIKILPQSSVSFKLSFYIDSIAKYLIDILMICQSKTYDNIYSKEQSSSPIKTSTDRYTIKNGRVELNLTKRLTFETLYPIKTMEKFFNNQMKNCYIEETIINQSNRTLILFDLKMSPSSNKNQYFELINKDELKNIIIEPNIELNVIFRISNPDLFLNESSFILNITWGNLFDINPKKFIKNIENGIDVYNSNFTLNIVETPEKNILENQSFKVIFSLNKKSKKNLVIFVEIESLKDNEKSNDREIEIIDIVDKKIELTNHNPLNTFCLICKSDVLGNVTLPKIKLTIFDSHNNEQLDIYSYEKLLTFNCVSEIN
jgi:hypothetical protein